MPLCKAWTYEVSTYIYLLLHHLWVEAKLALIAHNNHYLLPCLSVQRIAPICDPLLLLRRGLGRVRQVIVDEVLG